ncbi:MAG: hypothetical protein HYU43_06025, partial [Armatimonadetes bacterium]|nr:hypothetical protein [Armatimonadota bacterium]
AAVDWEIAGGAWGMMNRWICDPRWSWFGGMSRGIVAAWNKHEVRGDLRVDVTVAFMMFREQRPIERPGDLGVTFYGDGKSLFSGYTFLVGGEQNSWTRLYRNGEVVASTSEASFLLPEDRGDEDSLDAIHRHWFHLQVRRRGNLVTGLYQGVPALQFEDPEPIESGRIAIWSVNNGILLARVQVLPEHLAGYNVPQRTWTRVDGPPLTNWVDGQIDAALEKQEEGVWTVRNLLSGGHFAVRLLPDHITPGSRARLRFDCKFDPGVRVDLYFQAGRRTLKYGLTGPPKAEAILRPSYLPEAIPLAGRAGEKLDDGQWHTVTLDLSGYSGEAEGLSHFTFANYSNEDYLLAGYSANAVGAAYYVRNISFSEEKP